MKIKYQRLRNLTTGRLHTQMQHIYDDLGRITGQEVMEHIRERAINAVEPWLRQVVSDERFWNGEYDPEHVGELELPDPTEEDRQLMTERFSGVTKKFYGEKYGTPDAGEVK